MQLCAVICSARLTIFSAKVRAAVQFWFPHLYHKFSHQHKSLCVLMAILNAEVGRALKLAPIRGTTSLNELVLSSRFHLNEATFGLRCVIFVKVAVVDCAPILWKLDYCVGNIFVKNRLESMQDSLNPSRRFTCRFRVVSSLKFTGNLLMLVLLRLSSRA